MSHLRDYQERAVTDVRAALSTHQAVVLAMQVGAGKTSVAAEIIRLATERGRRVLFLAHRVELIQQAHARLAAWGVDAGVIKAGIAPAPRLPVQVACVPTLIRRTFPPADLVLIDECHHVSAGSWMEIARHYLKAGSHLVGLTATPLRLDGRPLGEIFQHIVAPVSTRELVDGGYLIAPTVYAPPVDLSKLPKRAGDYSIPELAERMSPLCGHVIKTWERLGRGRRTVAFAVNIEHSRLIEAEFARVGARVEHVDGKSSPEHRRSANARLRSGDLDVVTQVGIWTEGVDLPELSCLVIARPTKSMGLHRQMIGRVMRPAPGKADALILDHAGNHLEHGSILDEIEWSLSGPPRRAPAPSVRTCKECFAVLLPGAEACQECGTIVAPDERGGRENPGVDGDGELVLVDLLPRGAQASAADKRAEYERIVSEASLFRRKLGWARHKFKLWSGGWPRMRDVETTLYKCPKKEREVKQVNGRTLIRCAYCYQDLAVGFTDPGMRVFHTIDTP